MSEEQNGWAALEKHREALAVRMPALALEAGRLGTLESLAPLITVKQQVDAIDYALTHKPPRERTYSMEILG